MASSDSAQAAMAVVAGGAEIGAIGGPGGAANPPVHSAADASAFAAASPAVAPTSKETLPSDLLRLLESNDVHADVYEWCVKSKCNTVGRLANWATDKSEVKEFIFDAIPSLEGKRDQLAVLRQVWDEACALMKHRSDPDRKRLQEEVNDDPLSDGEQKTVEQTFARQYDWALEPSHRGSDTLLGRTRREFKRWAPSLFDVSKVRSMSHATKAGIPKRQRTGNLEMNWIGEVVVPDTRDSHRIRGVLDKFTILGNTWGMAGCFRVSDNSQQLYCHWQEAKKYIDFLHEETLPLLDDHEEHSVANYLVNAEHELRGKALELARCGPAPPPLGGVFNSGFGEALEHLGKAPPHSEEKGERPGLLFGETREQGHQQLAGQE